MAEQSVCGGGGGRRSGVTEAGPEDGADGGEGGGVGFGVGAEMALALALGVFVVPALVALGEWAWRRARMVRLVERMPGPFALPLLGTIVTMLGTKREDIFKIFDKRTKQYWPVMRTWKGPIADIHLSNADDIEVILSSTTHINKSYFYRFLRPWLGDGLLTSTGEKWHAHRKLITPTFHFKILESFMEIFSENSQKLVQVMEKELENHNGFDIYPYITLCVLDIICETAMGTQINAQYDSHSEYVKAIYDISERMFERVMRPWLYPDFIFVRSSIGKRYLKNLATLHGFTEKVIRERKKTLEINNPLEETNKQNMDIGEKRRLAFLDLLLEASQGGAVLNDEEIREEVDTFMFEGHDTTSAGICWTLFLLGTYTEVQEKVVAELDSIFQESNRSPTMQDLSEMKYLERVIKESLRLYPSVPIIGRHVFEDVNIGKYTIPAGCDITLHIYHVHRNPDYFPDPDKFDPDNFLPERVKGRHPFAYIPFSAGSRNCIGQKFALLEEKTVLSTLLRHYAFTALDRAEDLKLTTELILRPLGGIRLRARPRTPTLTPTSTTITTTSTSTSTTTLDHSPDSTLTNLPSKTSEP